MRDKSKAISPPALMRTPTLRRAATCFCVAQPQPLSATGQMDLGRPKEVGNSIKRHEAVSKGQPSHHSEPGVLTAACEFVGKELTIFVAKVISWHNDKLPIVRIVKSQIQNAGKEQFLQGTKKQDPPALQHISPVAARTSR